MCYGTRVVKTAKQLELQYNIEKLYREMEPGSELAQQWFKGLQQLLVN